jgi:bacterioferritin
LKNELTATNQYWLHYRLLDNWGVHKLSEFERSESIDEMKHADRLAERVLFLDGLPNFQALGRLHIGENVEEILRADMELEMEGPSSPRDHRPLRESARLCQPRPRREILEDERAISTSSKAVRLDQGDGPAELHSVAVEPAKE